MREFFQKNHDIIIIAVFAAFLAVFSLMDVILPDRETSEMENRELAKFPELSVSELVSGRFAANYEEYISDQFILRDFWIDIKSRAETLLGKTENNGIVYGRDGYMFEKYYSADERRMMNNTNFINRFCERYGADTTLAIVPNSYMILSDKLPRGLENLDQTPYIGRVYSALEGASGLWLNGALSEHADEYIYYRTDHHYTTYGAYIVYCEYMRSIGREPVSLDALTAHEVEGFYGTHYSKTKLYSAQPDTITWYEIPGKTVEIDNKPADGIYDLEKFGERDKYAAFLHGNHSLTVIRSEQESDDPTRILLIKDSFGNELAPFLACSFDEVYIVDPRYTSVPVSSFMEEVEFDEVLILYNFMNFAADTNVINITQ